MDNRYVVFWIPTIFHDKLKEKKTEICNDQAEKTITFSDGSHDISFFDVSDGSKKYPYGVKFKLLPNWDIVITSKVQTSDRIETFETTLLLEDKYPRKNGFIQFSFDIDTIPERCRIPFRKNLNNSFYHKIKEFWHEHECDTGKDSDLHPKIGRLKFDLLSDDNPALLRLLGDFSDLFCENAKNAFDLNKEAKGIEKKFDDVIKIVKEHLVPSSIQDIEKLDELRSELMTCVNRINSSCENSSIEYTYYKTLLSSIHNKSFKHDVDLDEKELELDEKEKGLELDEQEKAKRRRERVFNIKNAYRRKALNIRNAVRYIENIKYKNQNRYNKILYVYGEELNQSEEEIADKTTAINLILEKGKKWERLGIALAIYSSLITLLFGIENIPKKCYGISLIIISISLIVILCLIFNIPKRILLRLKKIFKR